MPPNDQTAALLTLTAFLTMVQQVWYEETHGELRQLPPAFYPDPPATDTAHAAPTDDAPPPMANPTTAEELFEVYTRGLVSDEELLELIRAAVRQLSDSDAA